MRTLSGPQSLNALLSERERRWSEALPPRLQTRYRVSRALLRRCLAPLLECSAAAVPLHSPPGQAPRLPAGLGFVSLSHSRRQLLLAWSPAPIGVDLEWAERSVQAGLLARRFFPPVEAGRLLALPVPEQRRALLESWVRKEAAIKWQGTGLAQDLRHWCWDAAGGQLHHQRHGWMPASRCELRQGWLCGAVGEGVGQGIWG